VMEDAILTKEESPKYPETFSPLYSGRKGEEPDCS
jgi:putative lipoprotein